MQLHYYTTFWVLSNLLSHTLIEDIMIDIES